VATTLQEVAAHAGVSLATASRVLNKSARRPGPAITAKVQAAALELGYVPNAQAQALARSTTGLIGLVVHDIADPYFSTIAAGVQSVAQAEHRQTLLVTTGGDPALEREAVRSFASHRTEAVILAGSRRSGRNGDARELETVCSAYAANGGRVALVGQPLLDFSAVVVENRKGARLLARELVAAGHRRFGILEGPRWLRTSVDRADAFARELSRHAESGAPVTLGWRLRAPFSRDGAYRGMRELIAEALPREKLCVFAVSDVMGLGVLAACRDAGLSVPADVAVAGFDDINILADVVPSLTTVRLDLFAMGQSVARLALDNGGGSRIPFPATPVVRDSTRI
jgi:LacI family transcriptional regulator